MKRPLRELPIIRSRKTLAVITVVLVWAISYILYYRYFGALPQGTISLFQEMPHPTKQDVVVVFSPHQDDETLGAGGYIHESITVGAQVYVVFATDGDHRRLKTIRQQESQKAAHILGVPDDHLIYYNYPDLDLEANTLELNKSVHNTLLELRPTIVLVTDLVDIHPDHAVLGTSVAREVARAISNPKLYTFLIHYPEYPRPQQFRSPLALLPPVRLLEPRRQWLKFTLTQSNINAKHTAVLQYKSQLRTPILRSLILSFIRQNEIFSKETP